jgi:hypothetical protein
MRSGGDLLGWATDSLVQLDGAAPGLLARVLTASPRSRQAIFTVLATRLLIAEHDEAISPQNDCEDVNLAFVLREGRAREILAFAFGNVPSGWLGALERLGGQPLGTISAYVKLHALFASPGHRSKAEALRHVGQITERMLHILDALDDRWIHAEALRRLPNLVAAKDFNQAVAFAQAVCSKATDDAVVTAITRLPPTSPLSSVVSRFIRRADRFPPHPVTEDDEIRPLTSARDFITAARRYRNCLAKEMLDEALAGHVAFAEFRGECIVEFRPLSLAKGWLLHEVHVKGNGFVDGELAAAARLRCESIGIPNIPNRESGEAWRRYRRFVRSGCWLDGAA